MYRYLPVYMHHIFNMVFVVPAKQSATYFFRVSDKIVWVSNISPLTHPWVSENF